ncbi:MAG: tetratricopeptide repeat protein [Bacteroidia bacterium]
MKKFRITSTFTILLLFFQLHCSSQNTDSLWTVYSDQSQADTNRLSAICDLAWKYVGNKPDSAIVLADLQYQLAKASGNKKYQGSALTVSATANTNKGDYPKALDCYERALNFFIETGNKKNIAKGYNNLGNVYIHQSDYPKALSCFLKGLKLSEEINNTRSIANGYHNIGIIYMEQNDNQKAEGYLLKALRTREKEKDVNGIIGSYTTLGNLYSNLHQYQRAVECQLKATKLSRESGDNNRMGNSYMNLGNAYNFLPDYQKSLEAYLAALGFLKGTGNKPLEAACYTNMSALYFRMENYKRAIAYCDSALRICIETDDIGQQRVCYANLANSYERTGQYKEAYENHRRFKILTDSIFNAENSRLIGDLKTSFEVEKKESENRALAQQNKIQALTISKHYYLMAGLIGLLLVFVLIFFFVIRQNKLRSEQRAMQLEQKLLRIQMNPHFIFNSLNSIHSVVLNGDKKNAAIYLASFSKLIRSILESSRFELISLEKEIALLENYIGLQLLRFENEIGYHINVDPKLELKDTMLPPMLTQPFIENAIEHGLHDVKDNAQLLISFKRESDFLHIEVCDNGHGLRDKKQDTGHISMATNITQERLQLLNRNKRKKSSFEINDAFPGNTEHKGVKVSFLIPFLTN